MSPELRLALNNDGYIADALAVLKVAIEKGDSPTEGFRKALASVVYQAENDRQKPTAPLRPDEQVALANALMRNSIGPALPPSEGAVLILFPFNAPGLLTYISNGERADIHEVLRSIVTKWDNE